MAFITLLRRFFATVAAEGRDHIVDRLSVVVGPLVAVAAFVGAAVLNGRQAPIDSRNLADLQLDGHEQVVTLNQLVHDLDVTVHWDFALIVGDAIAVAIGIGLLRRLTPEDDRTRRWLHVAYAATILAVVAGIVADLLTLQALRGHVTLLGTKLFTDVAVATTLKFCSLVPAGIAALGGLLLAFTRGLTVPHTETIGPEDVHLALPVLDTDPSCRESPPDQHGAHARWERGYALPQCTGDRGAGGTGIGLSGGGVRAATVALGALQSAGLRPIVAEADHLVSVSGGGYTSGAIVQALSAAVPPANAVPPNATVIRDAKNVFAPGSPEEDHVRRHSSYLADNPIRLVLALVLLARHLLLTLVLLFGPAVVLGVLFGRFYVFAPVTRLTLADNVTTNEHTVHLHFRLGAWYALAVISVVALVLWLASQGASRPPKSRVATGPRPFSRWRDHLAAASRGASGLAALVAALTLGIPGLIWVSSWLLHAASPKVEIASPIGGVLLTYIASLASFGWRNRARFTVKGGKTAGAPPGLLQLLFVILALVVLGAAWLVVFGGMATVGIEPHLATSTWATVAVITGVVIVLGVFTDETTLSLHPFYRGRIASAFAVRRVRREDGQYVAVPYADDERTSLSTHGVIPPTVKFPHVVFAASATLGEQRTPPGSNRISYTMCAHWVGGPEVGYVASDALERVVSPRLHRDLTVQAAVAISGAAIAASSGGQGSQWYETLLAVSGARLGAWLPNPRFVAERYETRRTLTRPGLPRVRRAHYLLRELFGGHPVDGPLLQITDGGFYDNLGLVELFRRRCTRIVCVDASGDPPPVAGALAQALRLAYEELGVKTDLLPTTWATSAPGGGVPLAPKDAMAALNARLSESGVISGSFEYPDGTTGRLVVAKNALWPQLPYSLLAYAQENPAFPHDSTGDQFFDDQQYAAYTELGRRLGDAAAGAL